MLRTSSNRRFLSGCLALLAWGGMLLADAGGKGIGEKTAGPSPAIDSRARIRPVVADHWAFVSPRHGSVPRVKMASWVRNPVDAFILERLEREGLSPSPPADRSTLIRRLYLDLTGLLPSPEELKPLLAAGSNSSGIEALVDRLLASPHFGERWGRHWLDFARYADSDGYEDDRYRPHAFRYRDWVIQSWNEDQSFDRFVIEQIAGDLLPNATYQQRLATGFNRMTLSNNAGAGGVKEEYRIKAVKDRVNTTGTVFLGLTVGCAQCHSHKYDPITQIEYYQLFAFFNNAKEQAMAAPRLARRYYRTYRRRMDAFEARIKRAKRALADFERDVLPGRLAAWERAVRSQTQVPDTIRQGLRVPPESRSADQQAAIKDFYGTTDLEYAALKEAVLVGGEITNNRPLPPSEKAMVLVSKTPPRKSYVHRKGNFLRKGIEVHPGIPAFLPPLRASRSSPDRYDLARWIASKRNPLTARVAVNHIWQHLFGRGIVETPDNFGVKGAPPSHERLLDWLAVEFMDRGWSRKAIIRLIVGSATYRQRSRHRPELDRADPGNRLLGRQNRFRVEAECVRDLALVASGLLNTEMGGPAIQPPLPAALTRSKELRSERFMDPSTGPDRYRRGVYVNVQRTFLFPMLKTFDFADANLTCVRRERSDTPLQALTLLNDPAFYEAAQRLGARVIREAPGQGASARIAYLYRLCLLRDPAGAEMGELKERLHELIGLETGDRIQQGAKLEPARERAVWASLARIVINLDEFITRE